MDVNKRAWGRAYIVVLGLRVELLNVPGYTETGQALKNTADGQGNRNRTSVVAKAWSAARTARTSASRSAGTCRHTLQVAAMPMSSMTAGADVVPTTSSRRPFGGCFLSSTSSVCAAEQSRLT